MTVKEYKGLLQGLTSNMCFFQTVEMQFGYYITDFKFLAKGFRTEVKSVTLGMSKEDLGR